MKALHIAGAAIVLAGCASGGSRREQLVLDVVCRSNGECLEDPLPLDNDLVAVTGNQDELWGASGEELLRWSGGEVLHERVSASIPGGGALEIRDVAETADGTLFARVTANGSDQSELLVRDPATGVWSEREPGFSFAALAGRNGVVWSLQDVLAPIYDGEMTIWNPPVPAGTPVTLTVADVPPSSSSDFRGVWAAAADGSMYRLGGSGWELYGTTPIAIDLRDGYAPSSDELWFVEDGIPVHAHGGVLDPDPIGGFDVVKIVGTHGSGPFALDASGRAMQRVGDAWIDAGLLVDTAGPPGILAGAAFGGEIELSGREGLLARWRPGTKAIADVDSDASFVAGRVTLAPNATADGWSLSDDGRTLWRRSGDGRWHPFALGANDAGWKGPFFARTTGEPWVEGGDGKLLRWDGSGFVTAYEGVTAACAGMDGSVLALDSAGDVAISPDGVTWSSTAGSVPLGAVELHCDGSGVAWAARARVSAEGVVVQDAFSPGSWRSATAGPGDVWLVRTDLYTRIGPPSDFSAVEHLEGAWWTTLRPFGTDSALDVAADGPEDVWVVGAHGDAASWNGTEFSRHDVGVDEPLVDVRVDGPADVTAVGASGSVHHFDGSAWTTVSGSTLPAGEGPLAAAGLISANQGFGVGADARVFEYADGVWTAGPAVFTSAGEMAELDIAGPADVWAMNRGMNRLFHFDGSTWKDQSAIVPLLADTNPLDDPTDGAGLPVASLAASPDGARVLGRNGAIAAFDAQSDSWVLTPESITVGVGAPYSPLGALVPLGGGTWLVVEESSSFVDDGVELTGFEGVGNIIGASHVGDGTTRLIDANGSIWRPGGDDGLHLRFLGATNVPPGDAPLKSAVLGADPATLTGWAVGANGSPLLRLDGASWVEVDEAEETARAGQRIEAASLAMDAFGTVLVATADGRILRFGD